MTAEKDSPNVGLAALIKQLTKATGLSADLAQAVIETATDYVKAQMPDKAEAIDQVLTSEKTAQKVGNLVEKLAAKIPKPDK